MQYSKKQLSDILLKEMQDTELEDKLRYSACVELNRLKLHSEEVTEFLEYMVEYSETGYKSRSASLLYRMNESNDNDFVDVGIG